MNLTKCQEETIAALDKLAADPPLLGVFVPKCKPDGHYEDEQCHKLFCWCVDKDGTKIPDTNVRGSAVCLPQGKVKYFQTNKECSKSVQHFVYIKYNLLWLYFVFQIYLHPYVSTSV